MAKLRSAVAIEINDFTPLALLCSAITRRVLRSMSRNLNDVEPQSHPMKTARGLVDLVPISGFRPQPRRGSTRFASDEIFQSNLRER
jgi:hypothetical protein